MGGVFSQGFALIFAHISGRSLQPANAGDGSVAQGDQREPWGPSPQQREPPKGAIHCPAVGESPALPAPPYPRAVPGLTGLASSRQPRSPWATDPSPLFRGYGRGHRLVGKEEGEALGKDAKPIFQP